MMRGLTIAAAILMLSGVTSPAATIWDESVNGDLSNNNLVPTVLPGLSVGANDVIGTITGSNRVPTDPDFFTITIPVGFKLDAITLKAFSFTNNIGTGSFLAVQAGTQITSTTDGSALLGTALAGSPSAPLGSDLLAALSANSLVGGVSHFTPPLQAGTDTFWFQEGAGPNVSAVVNYDFAFQLSAVPEPASLVLMSLGLAAVAGVAWRRRGSRGSGAGSGSDTMNAD
jgi:hypothetical protein